MGHLQNRKFFQKRRKKKAERTGIFLFMESFPFSCRTASAAGRTSKGWTWAATGFARTAKPQWARIRPASAAGRAFPPTRFECGTPAFIAHTA